MHFSGHIIALLGDETCANSPLCKCFKLHARVKKYAIVMVARKVHIHDTS